MRDGQSDDISGGMDADRPADSVAGLSDADYAQILRYTSGECLPGEVNVVRAWIAADADRSALAGDLLALRESAPAERGWHTEQWVTRLQDALHSDLAAGPRRVPTPPLKLVTHLRVKPVWCRPSTWGIAAAMCGAVAIAFMTYRSVVAPSRVHVREPARTYATTAGQRADLRLSDGTRVRMAPGSKVRIADFGTARRDVYLEGEAYFDVVHDPARPFTVYAGNASARDIGTSFSVRSYTEDRATRVVVREGEVALSGAGPLRAGDVGRLTSTGTTTVRHDADVDALLSWVDGRYTMAYRDAPLAQVIGDMRRWDGIEVVVPDTALLTRPFTGTLDGMSSAEAVGVVAASMGLRAHQDGERFVLDRPPPVTR
jgi:transmembrane sensor